MDRLTTRIAIAALSACVSLGAVTAAAQTKPAPAQGTLVLEPSSDGPVIAPEVRFTNFEHGGYGTLIGGYGGWLVDSKLLLGGGASFLVDHGHHDSVAGMGYGGFVAGWFVPAGRVLHAGVRALVGFGQASLTDSFTYAAEFHPDPRRLATVRATGDAGGARGADLPGLLHLRAAGHGGRAPVARGLPSTWRAATA